MSHTLFVSDLHLAPERPHINQQFFDFVERTAPQAEALYILGDLFEYWIGDDDSEDPLNGAVERALGSLAQRGVRICLMHGNRDLLIGNKFARRSSVELITDPSLLDLYGTPTLLMHGDTLCTEDVEYQKFRAYAHDPTNQAEFLSQPLAARRKQMREMRARSEQSKQTKTSDIMDVSRAAVEAALRANACARLIHGHTHRPARHVHVVDERRCERWVLNDWYQRGGYLKCDITGCTAIAL